MIENINDLKIRQLQTESLLREHKVVSAEPAKQDFSAILNEKLEKSKSLQFSKHSKERIQQRGIAMTDALIEQMNTAADSAREKGAKDVVMIGSDAAFIVNLSNNVVITAMNENEMKNNIFTNIDGAVLL